MALEAKRLQELWPIKERIDFHLDDLENDLRGLNQAMELGHYEAVRQIANGMSWTVEKLRELNG